jgi:hypothetical protein
VNTKRDWLICGHGTSDKCNVPAGQQVKNCCPPRPATYINKQNGSTTSIIRNYDFQVCVQIKNVKEKKNTQQATGSNAAEIV